MRLDTIVVLQLMSFIEIVVLKMASRSDILLLLYSCYVRGKELLKVGVMLEAAKIISC
jgi:hypothetical protein